MPADHAGTTAIQLGPTSAIAEVGPSGIEGDQYADGHSVIMGLHIQETETHVDLARVTDASTDVGSGFGGLFVHTTGSEGAPAARAIAGTGPQASTGPWDLRVEIFPEGYPIHCVPMLPVGTFMAVADGVLRGPAGEMLGALFRFQPLTLAAAALARRTVPNHQKGWLRNLRQKMGAFIHQHPGVKSPYDGSPFLIEEAGVPILLKELGVADAYVRSAWLALRAPYGWQAPVQAKVDVRTQTRKNGTPEAEAEAFMSNPKNSRMVVKILRRHPELVGDTLEGGVLRGVDESVMRRKFNEVSAQIAVLSAVTMRASGTTAYTEEIYPIVRSIAESLSDCRLLCAPQIALTAVREHCPVPAGDCTPTVTRLVPRSDARGVQVPGRTVAPRAVLGQLQRLPAEMRPGGAGKKKVGDRKHYSKGQRDRARQAIEWVRQPAALGGGDGKLPRKDSLRFDGLKLRIVSHIFIEWRRVQKFLQRAGGVKFEVRARQLAQQGQLAEGSSSGEDDREDVDSNGSKSTSDGEMDDQEDGDEDEGETGPGSGTRSDPGAGPEVAVARRGVGLLPPTGSIDHASNQPVGASLPVPQAPALVSPATLQLNSVTRHPALQLESLLPGTGPQGAGGAEGAAGMSAGGGVDARAFTGKSNDEGGCLDRALVGVQGRGEQGIDETESANIPQIGRRN